MKDRKVKTQWNYSEEFRNFLANFETVQVANRYSYYLAVFGDAAGSIKASQRQVYTNSYCDNQKLNQSIIDFKLCSFTCPTKISTWTAELHQLTYARTDCSGHSVMRSHVRLLRIVANDTPSYPQSKCRRPYFAIVYQRSDRLQRTIIGEALKRVSTTRYPVDLDYSTLRTLEILEVVILQKRGVGKSTGCDRVACKLVAYIWRTEAVPKSFQ